MATYTPEQFDKLIDRVTAGLPNAIAKSSFVASQQLRSDITGRIFSGTGTKDTEGNTRGYLSVSHRVARKKEGLQTRVVDHVFTGNLQRSVKLFKKPEFIDLRIFGNDNVKKARDNEDLYKSGEVFEASDAEEKNARLAFQKQLKEYFDKYFE